MVWGDEQPIDTTNTTQFDRLDATMSFPLVGDEDLAAMGPTQTLTDQPAAKRSGAHRRPHREVLTWPQTGAVAVVLVVLTVGAVWALSGSDSPAPEAVRQAAPDVPVATTSLTPTAKPKPSSVRPVEPVVHRQGPPVLPVRPSAVRTVTVTVTPKPTAIPKPTPKPSSPKPTASPTPHPTSPDPVEPSEPADPDEDPTPDTEATDDDN